MAFANAIKEVISPSKKVILNDIYKDIPSTSTYLDKPSAHQNDQLVYGNIEDSDSDDSDIIIVPTVKEERISKQFTSRKLEIQSLVEKREIMRNSRLRPDMVGFYLLKKCFYNKLKRFSDSTRFEKFQQFSNAASTQKRSSECRN